MTPSWREIVYGVFGAWRLFRRDSGAMTYFDDSVDGFWKSFFAAVLIAPAYGIIVALELARLDTTADLLSITIIEAATGVVIDDVRGEVKHDKSEAAKRILRQHSVQVQALPRPGASYRRPQRRACKQWRRHWVHGIAVTRAVE